MKDQFRVFVFKRGIRIAFSGHQTTYCGKNRVEVALRRIRAHLVHTGASASKVIGEILKIRLMLKAREDA